MKNKKDLLKLNSNIETIKNDMINTMETLYNKKLLYFYNEVKIEGSPDKQIITWPNHVPGRANCGKEFSKLNQYEYILRNQSWSCMLFDGSIIRSTFTFKSNKLVGHSHLWWPSPSNYKKDLDANDPLTAHLMFKDNKNWYDSIHMRSPIRIDYDPTKNTNEHPAVHMHTQHEECRIYASKPICFNRFIKYIFDNFYPYLEIDLNDLHIMTFTYDRFKDKNNGTSIIL